MVMPFGAKKNLEKLSCVHDSAVLDMKQWWAAVRISHGTLDITNRFPLVDHFSNFLFSCFCVRVMLMLLLYADENRPFAKSFLLYRIVQCWNEIDGWGIFHTHTSNIDHHRSFVVAVVCLSGWIRSHTQQSLTGSPIRSYIYVTTTVHKQRYTCGWWWLGNLLLIVCVRSTEKKVFVVESVYCITHGGVGRTTSSISLFSFEFDE